MLVEELAKIVGEAGGSAARNAIGSIFLVAPKLPSEEPEWVRAMKHLMIAPRSSDLTIFVKSLENAQVGELYKIGDSAEAIATRIDNSDEAAIVINMGDFSSKFTRPANQIQAFAGTANDALGRGYLELPSIHAVYDFFAVFIRNPSLIYRNPLNDKMTAHSAS